MKKLLFTVIILMTFKGYSQDPELDDHTWYLQNVIINGEDHFAPVNAEITDITLDFLSEDYDFNTQMCNNLIGSLNFDDGVPSFTFTDINQTLVVCGITENSVYEQQYFCFYLCNSTNPFTYSIIPNSDSRTLIVTDVNGDQAIYGSARLHVNEFRKAEIKAYPNPVENLLTIEKQNSSTLNIRVYNIHGQLMFSNPMNQELSSSIDVSSLKPGVYFFVFEDDHQRKEIRKIIKE